MMPDDVFWIRNLPSGRLGTMACPRGGDELDSEIDKLVRSGVQVLVSALERAEAWELELDQEAARCRERGIRFVSFPIPDRGVPASDRAFRDITAELATCLANDKTVVVHCYAGIGRSSLLAAGILAHQGMTPSAAFVAIKEVRGLPVPDVPAQAVWLETVIESGLGQRPSDGAA